ncbi:MAG: DNA-binding protein WhiA, partial [Acetivibrio sp.]
MSFSKDVKEELSRQITTARHCQIAEIAAIISLCGDIVINDKNEHFIKVHTENLTVARKYFILIKDSFQISADISVRKNKSLNKNNIYTVWIKDAETSMKILQATKLID